MSNRAPRLDQVELVLSDVQHREARRYHGPKPTYRQLAERAAKDARLTAEERDLVFAALGVL